MEYKNLQNNCQEEHFGGKKSFSLDFKTGDELIVLHKRTSSILMTGQVICRN